MVYISDTCRALVASVTPLSSRTRMKRGKRSEMPFSGSMMPMPARCTGLSDRSAHSTSHTCTGSNQSSGTTFASCRLSQLRDRFAISYVASRASVFTIRPSQLPRTASSRKRCSSSRSPVSSRVAYCHWPSISRKCRYSSSRRSTNGRSTSGSPFRYSRSNMNTHTCTLMSASFASFRFRFFFDGSYLDPSLPDDAAPPAAPSDSSGCFLTEKKKERAAPLVGLAGASGFFSSDGFFSFTGDGFSSFFTVLLDVLSNSLRTPSCCSAAFRSYVLLACIRGNCAIALCIFICPISRSSSAEERLACSCRNRARFESFGRTMYIEVVRLRYGKAIMRACSSGDE
uniref:Uncharacterized protein n=1 Tax=Anopheles merus TaxID=30066 RepID=A0A182USL9_ANOME